MKTRLGGVTILRAGAAMALVAALAACGGGDGNGGTEMQDPPELTEEQKAAQELMERQGEQRTAISTAIGTAQGLVTGLDDDSTAEDVTAANEAIAAIRTAIAAAADLGASETGLNTLTADGLAAAVRLHQSQGSQRTAATGAIDTARTAVAGLSDGSSTNQQAMDAIDDAKKAIADATDLSAEQRASYTAQVTGFESTFLTHRQGEQRTAITEAISTAQGLVNALNVNSDAPAVQAATQAIATATKAITDAADIDDTSAYSSQVAGINGDLTAHNTRQTQRGLVDAAHEVAVEAIDKLDRATSSSANVEAARELVKTAKAAITTAASHLPPEEVNLLNSRINLVENQLDGIGTDVAAREKTEEEDRTRLSNNRRTATQLLNGLAEDRELLNGYEKASDAALKDAAKYSGSLRVTAVDGDSEEARANAQKVLGAKGTIEEQLRLVGVIRTNARTDKTTIAGLDDDTEQKEALERLVDYVISDADAVIEDINDDLADLVRDHERRIPRIDGERTPQTAAKRVANAISAELQPNGVPDFSSPVRARPGDDDKATEFRFPASAQTFAQIFGSNSRDVSGMEWDELVPTASQPDNNTINSVYRLGSDQSAAVVELRGIPVILECGGTCSINDDDELVGAWSVRPLAPTALYAEGDGDGYDDAMFAEYAYWLDGDGAVNVWSGPGEGSGGVTGGAFPPAAGLEEMGSGNSHKSNSATYSGQAGGYSVHDTDDGSIGDDDDVLSSGSFRADVTLQATFGSTNAVEGTIGGFESTRENGKNVDPNWSVRLNRLEFTGTTETQSAENGTGVSTGRDGELDGRWTFRPYGGNTSATTSRRPDGAYGAFDANFADGAAQGVYITERD